MKEISALDLRKRFGEVMDEVRYRKEAWMVTRNGRPVMVLMDVDLYQASKENFKEEAFIEEYSEVRIKEFMAEDKLDPAVIQSLKKQLEK